MLMGVKGLPWQRDPSKIDDHIDTKVIHVSPEDIPPPAAAQEQAQVKPLRVRLRPEDFEKYGYISGCPGCRAILRRGRVVSHNEECRKRM